MSRSLLTPIGLCSDSISMRVRLPFESKLSSPPTPTLPFTCTSARSQPVTLTEPAMFSMRTVPSADAGRFWSTVVCAESHAGAASTAARTSAARFMIFRSCSTSKLRREADDAPEHVDLLAVRRDQHAVELGVCGILGERLAHLGEGAVDHLQVGL